VLPSEIYYLSSVFEGKRMRMIIRKEIDLSKPLTNAQKEMLQALKNRPVTPDEDCPELTEGQVKKLKR
jgi:hypothetical protein